MPNTIIYQASTDDAVQGCAYSLLKYLAVYNLKPPADHVLQVYTHRPASLEMYGSFFNSFELKEKMNEPMNPSILRSLVNEMDNNVLFLGSSAYPVADLNSMFDEMKKGEVFIGRMNEPVQGGIKSSQYSVIGFNTSQPFDVSNAGSIDPSVYVAQYQRLKEFNSFLRNFFKKYQEESVSNQVKLIQHIDAKKIGEEKNAFSNLPFYARFLRKLTGNAWNIKRYTGKV